jgi:ATP-dependent Clp protease protease subunit
MYSMKMRKTPVYCDDCEEQGQVEYTGQTFKERVWQAYLQEKKILLNCVIDEDLIEKAVMQIFSYNEYDDAMEAENPKYVRMPIRIFINSAGGTLDEAFSLVSAIEASTTPVWTIALGKAYSAGFLILLAGHERYAQKRSTMMYHQGSAGISGEFSKVIEYAKHWESCQGLVDKYVIEKTKMKKKDLDAIFNNRTDSYMTTETALKLGVIDGVWTN